MSNRATVLVVDDEKTMLRAWEKLLAGSFEVLTADNGADGLELAGQQDVDLVVTDLMMPGMGGMELLAALKERKPEVEVVVMTGHATVETAVAALKAGAYDYMVKPFTDLDAVQRVVERAVDRKQLADRARRLEAQLEVQERFGEIVGESDSMHSIFQLVTQVAWSTTTVLIQGESGTGKELIARAIHFRSPRRAKPFVPVNCGALSETLLESELFGHAKGAFTGATTAKKGLFEAADGGTIFLDEIGEVSPSMQVRLLRVLNNGEVKAVGSNTARHFDVRVVAATNRDLVAAIADGDFREDLFYRLNVIGIDLPPLRERSGDIPLLAYHFLKKFAALMDKEISQISREALALLQGYRWPGNVRELENVMERAVVLATTNTVLPTALPVSLRDAESGAEPVDDLLLSLPYNEARARATKAFERRYFERLLARTDGNISEAARLAGVDRSNLKRVLKRHDMR